MVFALICKFLDKDTGYIEDTELTKFNRMYRDLLLKLCFRSSKWKKALKACISSLERWVKELSDTMVRLFEDPCESGLFTMKFHHFPHV